MVEGNDLDSLLTNNLTENPAVQNTEALQTQRPKMKKIKRAKVRLVTPIPPVPEKIMPVSKDSEVVSPLNDLSAFQSTDKEIQNIQSDNDLDILISKVSQNNEDVLQVNTNESSSSQNTNKGTGLITSVDAQELSSTDGDSPYVLEGLPPELDYETDEAYDAAYDGDTGYIKKSIFYIATCVCLLAGVFIGKTLFSSQTIEKHGLEGVVLNPDVPAGRPRCGLTDKNQACTFYIMNWYKQELNGRDFYKLAAQLTGRETYMIETDNLRYATVKIRPGAIAQLNIPALLK